MRILRELTDAQLHRVRPAVRAVTIATDNPDLSRFEKDDSFADSLTFERVHEETYRDPGSRLVDIPAGPLPDRVALIERALEVCP